MNLYTELIALDIGTSSIKLVDINQGLGKQGYRLKTLESVELPPGLVGGDFTQPFIKDVPQFKEILGRLTSKVTSRHQGYVVGLPDRWVKLHLNNMTLSDSELKSADFLRWRLEKILPIPDGIETMVDFQILNPYGPDANNQYQVLAAAVNKSIVDILSVLTTELKMEVMAFDTSSLGVFNLYEEAFPHKTIDQSVINLHIGNETTVVKIYRSGCLVYERVIEVAGESFTTIISELDSIEFDEAQKVKRTEKFFPVDREDVMTLMNKRSRIERIFGNWLRELNVTFRFYQEKFRVPRLPAVFITGSGGIFEGLPNFLTEYFETDCSLFNPLEEMPLTHKPDDKIVQRGTEFAACLGLLAK